MQKIMDNDGAALNFGRFGCGSIWEKAKNPLTGAVPNQVKAFFPRIPLASTTKQYPLKGFFIAAVLRRYNSAKVGVTDRVMHFPACAGDVVLASQGAPDAMIKGVTRQFTGLSSKAAGRTDFRHIVQRVGNAGQASEQVELAR